MAESMKWEYQVQTLGSALSGPKDEELQEVLDDMGDEGWEVITLTPIENSNKVRLVAKRPLTHAVRRRRTWPGQ